MRFAGPAAIPRLHLLANQVDDRLGILSFYVEGVHYNLVTTLLNDCFGVQVRGGCSCAGPTAITCCTSIRLVPVASPT